MSEEKGWICLFRKFLDWEWYDYPSVKIIFLHCLLSANHKTQKWRDIVVKRGQFVTSYGKLASLNGLTIQEVRTALEKLQSTQEITYQSTSQYSIITVKNYNLYQGINTGNNTANNKRTTTNNNETIIDISKEYIYNTHTSKNVCVENKISDADLKILRNYAKENGAKRIKPYVAKLIENGGYLDILKEEKEKIAKAERQKAKEIIPPAEKIQQDAPEDIEKARAKARAKVTQTRKGENK